MFPIPSYVREPPDLTIPTIADCPRSPIERAGWLLQRLARTIPQTVPALRGSYGVAREVAIAGAPTR